MEVTPNYSYVFDFENEFIHQDTRQWMIKNWTWVFYYCGVYMLIIFGGQFWMQNRPRWVINSLFLSFCLLSWFWSSETIFRSLISLDFVQTSFDRFVYCFASFAATTTYIQWVTGSNFTSSSAGSYHIFNWIRRINVNYERLLRISTILLNSREHESKMSGSLCAWRLS